MRPRNPRKFASAFCRTVSAIGLAWTLGCLVAFGQAERTASLHPEAGRRLAQAGDLKGAEAELRRAVEISPKDSAVLASLAQVLMSEGWLEEAGACFAQALALNPSSEAIPSQREFLPGIRDHVARYRGDQGPGEKIAGSCRAPSGHPFGRFARSTILPLGNVALTEGKTWEALEELKEAATLNPRSSKIHYALSRVYRQLGRSEEATRELRAYETLKAEEAKAELQEPGAVSTKE
jgi:tetratricopeptide (TPR) repeat protein